MPCYYPLNGYRSRTLNSSGKRSIVFNVRDGYVDQPVQVPCGRCIGCRLERSRQWAVRCMHESTLHEHNCVLSLTYDDEHFPSDGSLDVRHFQLFMKKLRRKYGSGIRFFHCGEYGERFGRPHYHAIIFGFDFQDKKFWKKTKVGSVLYVSEELDKLWENGHAYIGSLTFASACYIARYITKKVTGFNAEFYYDGLKPEYCTMSRGCKKLGTGGIGKGWYNKWKFDTYGSDSVFCNGVLMKPPKFYDSCFEHEYPSDFILTKRRRKSKIKLHYRKGYDLLFISEQIKKQAIKSLKRSFE